MSDTTDTAPELSPRRPFALRLPPALLACAAVPVGMITLPWAAFIVVISVRSLLGGSDGTWLGLVTMGVAPLVGYPAAAVLWSRSRRAATPRRAWILALLGVVVIVAVSFMSVYALGYGFYDEWKETQPGGRGYHP
ncbi:hypothetical protein Psi02_32770 [Planotetraspora silvatica]|uniref:Uncharacterized protein n=1 Tax=Planotetraspora silvatica TaxID=234614 RepID=A0A8J3UKD6_9ACTN|nr:hypothetical protein [Planotetraspora silvatica]GII46853.1 hypothetical protein Psi02_32770 [Planotetraspora silvatica]